MVYTKKSKCINSKGLINIKKIIAYDLGTGGVKASLYNENAEVLAKTFAEYETYYPGANMHEQAPADWWDAIVRCTGVLLSESGSRGGDVMCISISGHSLVAVPVDGSGRVLTARTPIWSDTRAGAEAAEFFTRIDESEWYYTTGNGFPPPCYSVFKLMWMKKHQPDVFSRIHKVLGSKDYINYMLTGRMYTDYSYASGTGAYDLAKGGMRADYLAAAGLPAGIFPEIAPSDYIIGTLTDEAAAALGLGAGTAVACGGVDNACMALGAAGAAEGGCYASLGSSSWIAVNSAKPVLNFTQRPYVFAHIAPGMFTSAFSIFSGGSSLRWVRENICRDVAGEGAYAELDRMAETAPIGSGGVLFNPSLAGGTSQDKSPHIRGAFLNLSLGNTREEMIRATMEGIAFNLKMSFLNLKEHVAVSDEILFCGGGSKSPFWMRMFADIFDIAIVKTSIDQDAASFGAAAAAFKGMNIWKDYSPIQTLHKDIIKTPPNAAAVEQYKKYFPRFTRVNGMMSELGDYLYSLREGD